RHLYILRIGEINVGPTISVVVNDSDTSTHRLDDEFLFGAGEMLELNSSGRGDVHQFGVAYTNYWSGWLCWRCRRGWLGFLRRLVLCPPSCRNQKYYEQFRERVLESSSQIRHRIRGFAKLGYHSLTEILIVSILAHVTGENPS